MCQRAISVAVESMEMRVERVVYFAEVSLRLSWWWKQLTCCY